MPIFRPLVTIPFILLTNGTAALFALGLVLPGLDRGCRLGISTVAVQNMVLAKSAGPAWCCVLLAGGEGAEWTVVGEDSGGRGWQ